MIPSGLDFRSDFIVIKVHVGLIGRSVKKLSMIFDTPTDVRKGCFPGLILTTSTRGALCRFHILSVAWYGVCDLFQGLNVDRFAVLHVKFAVTDHGIRESWGTGGS